MGAFGGGMYHFVNGWRNAPRGGRLSGALTTMRLRAPATGGAFAMWGGCFCTFDCTFTFLRKKEDPWNAVMAGACTGGILAARAGTRAIVTGAAVGGFLLGLIEGMGLLVGRMMQPTPMQAPVEHRQKPPPPPTSNIYGIPTDTPRRFSAEIGFNDVAEIEAEDRF